jgi:sulfite exporter TauE/SafE
VDDRIRAGLSREEGRRFALAVGGGFAVLGGIALWRSHPAPGLAFLGAGVALVLAGLALPHRLGPLHTAWMGLARAISKVTTPIVMGLIYYLVLSPTGLVRRVAGGNPMEHVAKDDDGFWVPRAPDRRRSDLNRQF